ncbi:MAG TPA: serine hydrolase [Thermomicrobiaceae bacterium]|nr:serine hydrolase [Thermomicrobiaceae bacterium]
MASFELLSAGTPPAAHAPAAPARSPAQVARRIDLAPAATPRPSPPASPTPVATPTPALQVNLTARAAFAVDLTHQLELYANNADTPLPPASTTKVVSALVVLQSLPLDTQVTIAPQDLVDPAIYSHMGLETGDVVTARDLLAGMLLPSGDDAAKALARVTGERLPAPDGADPMARFVAAMNRLAASLGMRHSHFLNPDGVDAPGHVSTARDLAIATAALFQHPLLQQLVAERSETVQVGGPNARAIALVNTNELLGQAGVHGVKTGTTDAAGQCLITAIWRGGSRIVTVVLGSSDRYADTDALLSALDGRYRWLRLGRDGDIGPLNQLLAEKHLSFGVVVPVILSREQAAELHYELQLAPQPGGGWTPQGSVLFSSGGESILRLPVYSGDPSNVGTPGP